MFGYVKPRIPDLRVREYELYRALYCGLCASMGQTTGQISRLTLNYDYVFLAAFRMVLKGIVPECTSHRCIAHPMKKRQIAEGNSELDYTSFLASAMLYEKLLDNRSDEKGMKSFLASVSLPYAGAALKKAEKKGFGRKTADSMHEKLKELYALESEGCDSVDRTAEIFGDMLGNAFSDGIEGSMKGVAYEAGRAVGRFVYVADAADDMTEDYEKKRYNPLNEMWGEMAFCEKDGRRVMSEITAESVNMAARLDLERLGLAVELLDASNPLTAVIKNIVYLGMPDIIDSITRKRMNGTEKNDKTDKPIKENRQDTL